VIKHETQFPKLLFFLNNETGVPACVCIPKCTSVFVLVYAV